MFIRSHFSCRAAALAGAALAALGAGARAQTAAASGPALETVVVTAQKRSEKLQDVPIAVNAFSGKKLKEAGIVQPVDLASETPNLSAKNAVGNTAPIFALRGLSLNDFATNGTQPVGVYLDEVYQVNNAELGFQLFDMERAEVLKGPQGTLYGRNTTAGAISFLTARPSDVFAAGLDVTAGSYALLAVDAFVNGKLTDSLSGRLSFSGERQWGGYFTNDENGKSWGQTRRVGGRGQLLWDNHDGTTVLVNLHGGIDRSDDYYYKYIADASGLPLGQFLQSVAKSENPDIFHGDHKFEPAPYIDNQSDGLTVTATHDYGPFTLHSISNADNLLYARTEDYGSVPYPVGWNRYPGHLSQFSEELRLTSSGDSWWKWIVGGFAGHDRLRESDVYNELDNPIYQGYIFNEKYTQNTTSYAVFTHNTIELAPNLRLTLGGRFTHEEKHYDGGTLVLQSNPLYAFDTCPCVVNTHLTYNEPTGKVGLDYRIGNALLYVSASRGYKAGGVTGFYVTDTAAKAPYLPEFINAYEAGVKTTWADNRLRANGAIFYYDYSDLQAFGVIDNEFRIFNVSKSRLEGGELEIAALPLDGVKIESGLGFLYTRVEKSDVGGVNVGNSLGNAPRLEWDNTASYTRDINDALAGSVALESNFRGSTYYYVQNNPFQRQESYWLFGPRASIGSHDDQWKLSFYMKNAGNRHYYREIFNDGGSIIGFPAPPLTYGFTLSYRWH